MKSFFIFGIRKDSDFYILGSDGLIVDRDDDAELEAMMNVRYAEDLMRNIIYNAGHRFKDDYQGDDSYSSIELLQKSADGGDGIAGFMVDHMITTAKTFDDANEYFKQHYFEATIYYIDGEHWQSYKCDSHLAERRDRMISGCDESQWIDHEDSSKVGKPESFIEEYYKFINYKN